MLAKELIGSTAWYERLWQGRERIAGKPALLLWGMKDPSFGPSALARWKTTQRNARTVEFEQAGHLLAEESPNEAVTEIRPVAGEPVMASGDLGWGGLRGG